MSNWSGGNRPFMRYFEVVEADRLEQGIDMIHAGFGVESPKHLWFELANECRDRLLEGALLGGWGR
eukprot:4719896-Pyramimonas_sp.AAC.1